jgi:hypothetical protein
MSDIRQEFKIRRQSDGKFSSGGRRPRWSDAGKTWSKPQHLSTHLGIALRDGAETYGGVPLDEVDVITLEMRPAEAEVTPLANMAVELVGRREARAAERTRRLHRQRLRSLEEEAERIRQRLGEAWEAVDSE